MNRSVEAIINHPVRTALAAASAPVVAFAINCGGDNKAPTPSDTIAPTATILETNSPMPSQTLRITEAPTASPSPTVELFTNTPSSTALEITPAPIPTDVPPTYEEQIAAVTSAYSAAGLEVPQQITLQIDACNEHNLTQEYAPTQLINACGGAAQSLHDLGPNIPEVGEAIGLLKKAVYATVDRLVLESKLDHNTAEMWRNGILNDPRFIY